MVKNLVSLVVAAVVITGGVLLYKNRHQLFRPDFERSGGTLLVFEVAGPPPAGGMEELAATLQKRLDGSGGFGIVVKPSGERQIEVGVPHGKQHDDLVEMVKRLAARPGVVEFRFVVNQVEDKSVVAGLKLLKDDRGPTGFTVELPGEPARRYRWVKSSEGHIKALRLDPLGLMRENPHDQINVEDSLRSGKFFSPQYLGQSLVQALKPAGRADPSFYVLVHDTAAGEDLAPPPLEDARVQSNGRSYLVQCRFALQGGERFREFLRKNVSPSTGMSYLGIILDGQLVATTPVSGSARRDFMIRGDFSRGEAEDLTALLLGGPLPCRLAPKPVRENTTGGK